MKAEVMDATKQHGRDEHSGRSERGHWQEAAWLGGKEIRRSWLSYPGTGLAMLVLAFIFSPTIDESLEGSYTAFLPDFIFLGLGAVLAVNWLSREYRQAYSRDTFSERLIFLRSLPVPSEAIVGGRMISLCFALLFTVPAFFTPLYLLTDLGQLGWSFVWFILIWVGYSLLGAGLWLLAEFGLSGRTYTILSFASVPVLIVAVLTLEWAVRLRAVERLSGLAQSHGPLTAIVSLMVGAVVFAVIARAATRRIESRDLSA